MTQPLNAATLARLADLIQSRLAAIDGEVGPYDHSDCTWHDRRRTIARALVADLCAAEGARQFFCPPHDNAIKVAGLRASSTSGIEGALHNWCAAARRAIDEGRAT